MDTPSIEELVPLAAVWERMQLVESRLIEVTDSSNQFLSKIARHYLLAGGKRFRPLLAQLAAELGPTQDFRSVDAGVAVELIHVGSLYHDDVIDEADSRRGSASANHNWDNTVAILAGDFTLARASEVAASSLGQEGVILLAQTYAQLCEGQVLELQLAGDITHGPDEYYQVIEDKTASLIRTSARLGAMASDADETTMEAVSSWAWDLGVAFQLIDDVLDLVASSDFLGKPAGSDVGEGTFTLPVLTALAADPGDELRSLLGEGRPYPTATIDRVLEIVRSGGYVEIGISDAEHRIRRAEKSLDELPLSNAREVMRGLGSYLMGQIDRARTS
ncbi:MAG: polyprenyl synthetase family protein [Acidimicrobiia bacterium]|nr:polyprenyl synthetase family protein [Acidimicrobiia bacterium]MBT8193790.1 polyprenyl synthetase family protein [Acidimicrobiia bacterium]NNF88953.1 polyprenyl synthetase family protein [Acidimicrobiia bacterium]NNJ47457.1 polyprenyl synthetase family protein [Acidimicrobiia bacterium]NNL13563.1 polyprenyl synthetase family protein [Acidimicrobiia bacterium]